MTARSPFLFALTFAVLLLVADATAQLYTLVSAV